MKIYDISQEILTCAVYTGDPSPYSENLVSIDDGEVYNLSALYMCNHNGTHVDAPFHFINDGKTIDKLNLEACIGWCYVTEQQGIVTAEAAAGILKQAEQLNKEAAQRILIKGEAEISLEAAEIFAAARILLIGNESQSIGPEDAPMAVHLKLLQQEVVLLEGIRLAEVPEGVYLLNAAPLNIGGAEGAPCRAVLLDLKQESEQLVERVKLMEIYFDILEDSLKNNPRKFAEDSYIQNCLAKLTQYYDSGEWLKDYQADETGKLPKDLKRGVLSEDGVYNLLEEIREG